MDMESSRKSFDRSREPGMKKPRLNNELEQVPSSSVRPFPQRQVASGVNTTMASARFRTKSRDFETSDSGLVGYQPQQPGLYEELITQYKTALGELTFNSKPIITNLTIIAGENLYAAKAIAATVCSNILEVPSEQKLPSLYLLDSIVKNIGRDYIKHFAASLPEVFCKAYQFVDPSVHPSMRHLFGTWKGVFPSHTLQMIERELGFTPAANGSSSAPSTLRSDLQSLRPPQSIHVNPKYLERQRLQSSQTKGVANDMTGVITNSTEDLVRPNRALGAEQPWNVERSQRDAFSDSVAEKTSGASYGGNEYGSDLSRNLSLGTGRTGGKVSELGHDKSWHEVGSGIETISVRRNGFGIKHGFLNHDAPTSMTLDTHLQPAQRLAGMRSSVTSTSWKNSEEEEFMWADINSGLTDHGASNVSSKLSKDHWRAEDENLAVEDHLQDHRPFKARVDREISTVSLSTEKKQLPASAHHPSLSWQLQEQHSSEEVNHQPGRSEGFASTVGLSISANSSIGRMGNQPFLPKAALGSLGMMGQQQNPSKSPAGQSTLIRQSPSRQVGLHHHPHQLQNSAQEAQFQTLKAPQSKGGLKSQSIQDSSPVLPSNVQVGKLRRSYQENLQGSRCSATSFQPKDHNAISKDQQLASSESEVSNKTEKLPLSKTSLPGETAKQPTTSSLLTAVMKSGVFSNSSTTSSLPNLSFLDKKIQPSQSGVQLGQDGSPLTRSISLGAGFLSPSSLGPANNDLCTPHNLSEEQVGLPPRLPALPPVSSAVSSGSAQTCAANPISNLLSSLVAKGLISAETESLSPTKLSAEVLTRLQDQSQSIATSTSSLDASVPGTTAGLVSSTGDEVDLAAKSCVALSQSVNTEIRNLIGFEFKPDVIRELHPTVINELLEDFPHHCSICGVRLKYQEQFDRHLDWHAMREREQNDIRPSRRWYVKSADWIAGKDEFKSNYTDSVDIGNKETDESEPAAMVPADENKCLCVLCGELFEDIYCQEKDEWMFKGAIYLTMSDSYLEMGIGNVSAACCPVIHAKCLPESSISSITKMEEG